MSGPALFGAILYAGDVAKLADFYSQVFGMKPVHATGEMTILAYADGQLIIHKSPHSAPDASSASPRDLPVKLFFTAEDGEAAKQTVATLGGAMRNEAWEGPTFWVANAIDPEGNVFHLRWSKV